MHPVKLHSFSTGGMLDRKMLREEFFFWAGHLNKVDANNIALRTLNKDKFKLDSFLELYGNRTFEPDTNPTKFYDYPVFTAPKFIDAGEPGDFRIDWSCNLQVPTAYQLEYISHIRIVPFAAGQLLWGAADVLQKDWPFDETGVRPNTLISGYAGSHSLSGQANFTSITARFDIGLIGLPLQRSLWMLSKFDGFDFQLHLSRIVR